MEHPGPSDILLTPSTASPVPCWLLSSPSCFPLQGMVGDKAKLEFVRTYYEFLPKSLYTDTRP
jgi:hypothetical protein